MPLGPSRVSNDGPDGPDGDARTQGFSAEKGDPEATEGDRISVIVSDYPYQENTTAYLRLTLYDPDTATNKVEWSYRALDQRIVQFAGPAPHDWSDSYNSSNHTLARVSSDQGFNWKEYPVVTPSSSTDTLSIKFARQSSKPAVDNDAYDPGSAWQDEPPSGSDTLWAIVGRLDTSNSQLLENWSDAFEATGVSGQYSTISPEDGTEGESQQLRYLISKAFSTVERQPNQFEIYWRVYYNSYVHRGSHRFDRNSIPQFSAGLYAEGNDLRLSLGGDEDVASYKVAINRDESRFPDKETGTYYEGQDFLGAEVINLGRLDQGESAYVTVTSYGSKEQNKGAGDPTNPGTARTLYLQRREDDPVPQVRFSANQDGDFYDEFSTGRTWMQISRDRGVNWSKSIDIASESAPNSDTTAKAYYFARGIGAPSIDRTAASPGTAWSDVPPSGSDPLWVTTGPVDSNGDLAGGRWASPYPVVGEVPPRTLPPERAYAEFSDGPDIDQDTWLETYSDTSPDHEYIRVRWSPGQDWQVVDMRESEVNPTDSNGNEITENPINRFQRSVSKPDIGGDQSKYDGPDSQWSDEPNEGSDPLWMISALADLDNDVLVGGSDGQWSDPIRLVPPSANKSIIEFAEALEGGFSPLYNGDQTHYHTSDDYGDTWNKTLPLSEVYFALAETQPSIANGDPSSDSTWQSDPPEGEPGDKDLWITKDHDGDGTWTTPKLVYRDTTPRGPDEVSALIQYSAEKITWHNDFREGDKWIRYRLAPGVYTDPIRIVGESGNSRKYFFQAHDDPDVAPEIDSTIPDWSSSTTYAEGDRVQYDGNGTWEFWEATTSNSGVTPDTSASEWDNVDPHTFDPDANWVDGPTQALDNGSSGEIYVWSIDARFEVDPNSTSDRRITPWDGPFRINGVDAQSYFIRPVDGTAIKNSNGTVQLKAIEVLGQSLTELKSGSVKMYVYDSANSTFETVSNFFGAVSDDHQPTFGSTEINGDRIIYLRDGGTSSDTTFDTVTLLDVTDGISGGYVKADPSLLMTHFTGPEIADVSPSPVDFTGVFLDASGTTHEQGIQFTGSDNGGDLEVTWTVADGSSGTGLPSDGQISVNILNKSGVSTTNPNEIVAEFTATDPNTQETTTFQEQLQFNTDDGDYNIRPLDGTMIKTNSGDDLTFEFYRKDSDGTTQLTLGSDLVLALRTADDTGDKETWSGGQSSVTITESDLSGSHRLVLRDGSGLVLDSEQLFDVSDGTDGGNRPTLVNVDLSVVSGSPNQGKLTFTVADPQGNVSAVKARRAIGVNLNAQSFDTTANHSWFSEPTTDNYEALVNLTKKHNSFIQVKLETLAEDYDFIYTFDEDQIPEIIDINAFADEDNVLSVGWIQDDDTDEVKLEWRKNSEIPNEFTESNDSPFTSQKQDQEITRKSNLIPVRLKESSDFADVRLTPKTSGGTAGDAAVVRVHKGRDNEGDPRGVFEKVTGDRSIIGQGEFFYLFYDPDVYGVISSFQFKKSDGDFTGLETYSAKGRFTTSLVEIDASNDELIVSSPGDQTQFWERVSSLEYINSPDDQTFTIQNVAWDATTVKTIIRVNENVPSGMDTSGDLRGEFYVVEAGRRDQTAKNVKVRVSFTDGGTYTELFEFGSAEHSTGTVKGSDGLVGRTDLIHQQVLTAQGLDNKDDQKGGNFYYDKYDTSTNTDGEDVLALNNLQGRLKRLNAKASGETSASTIGELSDVELTGPNVGEALVYKDQDTDGDNEWTNDKLGSGGIAADAITDTELDTSITYPIDITGDADTVDGYDSSDLAALAEDETVTGTWDFQSPIEIYAGGTHIDLIETPANKRWRFEVQGEDFAITEDNVALHFRIQPGGEIVASQGITAGGDIQANGSLLQSGNQAAIVTNNHTITGLWSFDDTVAFADGTGRIQWDRAKNDDPLYIQRASSAAETAVTVVGQSVAIGDAVASPNATLDVRGEVRAQNALIMGENPDGNATDEGSIWTDGKSRIALWTPESGVQTKRMALSKDSFDILSVPEVRFFSNDGYGTPAVGIGKIDPAYSLDVEGTGHFKNQLTVDSGMEVTSGTVGTDSFVSKTTGWGVDYDGSADFRSIFADELRVQAFTAEITQTLVGSQLITKSRARLASNFTVPADTNTNPLHVEDIPQISGRVFSSGDTIRLRIIDRSGGGLTVNDVWGTVSNYTDNGDGTQTWDFTRQDSGNAGATIYEGSVALDYGDGSDSGQIYTTVAGSSAPYQDFRVWNDSDGDNVADSNEFTILARIGLLDGITGANATGGGIYTSRGRFTDDIIVGSLDKSGQYLEYANSTLTLKGTLTITGGSGIANLSDADTSNLSDGANLGGTADWSGVNNDDGNKPADGADVTGQNTAKDITHLPDTPGSDGAGLYADGSRLGFYDNSTWTVYIESTTDGSGNPIGRMYVRDRMQIGQSIHAWDSSESVSGDDEIRISSNGSGDGESNFVRMYQDPSATGTWGIQGYSGSDEVFHLGEKSGSNFNVIAGWTFTKNTLSASGSDSQTNDGGGVTLAAKVGRNNGDQGDKQSYVCVHNSDESVFTSMYYAHDNSFGLVVKENGTKKVHFGDEMMLEGDLLVQGSVTVDKLQVAQLSELTEDAGIIVAGALQDAASNPDTKLDFDSGSMRLHDVELTGSVTTGTDALGGWTVGVDTLKSSMVNGVNPMVLDGVAGTLQIKKPNAPDEILKLGAIGFDESSPKSISYAAQSASALCLVNTDWRNDDFADSCQDPGGGGYTVDSQVLSYTPKTGVTYRLGYLITENTSTTNGDGNASASADAYVRIELRDSSNNVLDSAQAESGSGTVSVSTTDASLDHIRVVAAAQAFASATLPIGSSGPDASAQADADAQTGDLEELGAVNEFVSSKGAIWNPQQTQEHRVGLRRDPESTSLVGGAHVVGDWEIGQNSNGDLIAHNVETGTTTTVATS